MKSITEFQGEYRFLSNFWYARVELDGMVFFTVEHAYQSAKTLDMALRAEMAAASTPGKAKRLGQQMELRSDWEQIKIDVMYGLLKQKFQSPAMAKKLRETGDAELIEGNTWDDQFWGVCRGRGQNHLGKLLMRVREELDE